MQNKQMQQFNQDILASMDISYEELKRILQPILCSNKKYTYGKDMKDCLRHVKDIIQSHNHLRRNAYD